MQVVNPSGQVMNPEQQKKLDEERRKLDEDLKNGKISQAEYFLKTQQLSGGQVAPGAGAPGTAPQPFTPNPVTPGLPQLPPATGQAPIKPITPVTPQATGPKEEIPPIGQALAVGSEDIEVVECYKCSGLITVTTKQRPVIIACPTCGTKGEVDASEPEPVTPDKTTPKATEGITLDEQKVFQFAGEESKPKGPAFGSSLHDDMAKHDSVSTPTPTTPAPTTPTPTAPTPTAPTPTAPTPTTPAPITPTPITPTTPAVNKDKKQ